MATCDPQTLLNDGSCFLCLSEKELNVAVAQLLCDIASGGVPCACENLGGADSPLNNITPDFIGQVYVQDSGVVWQAGSLLSSSWTVLCDPTGGCNGMIWGPDATELDFFVWGNGTFPDANNFDTQPITSLSFPSLASVAGDFDFSSDSELVSVSAPMLTSAGAVFGYFCNNLTSVDLSSLATVTADYLDLSNCTNLTQLNLPLLQSVFGVLELNSCGLISLSCPLLSQADGVDCASCALTSVSFPVFAGGPSGFDCSSNQLTSLSLPMMVNGSLICLDNLLTSLSLPVFASVADNLICSDNQLSTLNLPALIGCFIFDVHNNQLTSITAPNFAGVGNTVDASNNALNATSIELLLHVAVASGATTVFLDGGTNAGLASLSAQGQADYATLFGGGANITINP